jgi:hypothetical protein
VDEFGFECVVGPEPNHYLNDEDEIEQVGFTSLKEFLKQSFNDLIDLSEITSVEVSI